MQKVESSSLFSRLSRRPCKSRGLRRSGDGFPTGPVLMPLWACTKVPMPVRPRVYVRRVLILRLVFNALARAKLAARGITTHTRSRGRREWATRARQPLFASPRLDLRDRPDRHSAIPDDRAAA